MNKLMQQYAETQKMIEKTQEKIKTSKSQKSLNKDLEIVENDENKVKISNITKIEPVLRKPNLP